MLAQCATISCEPSAGLLCGAQRSCVAAAAPLQKMPFRLNFSNIYPEPVLVKLIVFSIKWLNKGAFRTNPR